LVWRPVLPAAPRRQLLSDTPRLLLLTPLAKKGGLAAAQV
jgi:hypothetical protein